MSVTPNLCCDKKEPRNIHSHDTKMSLQEDTLVSLFILPLSQIHLPASVKNQITQ